MDTGEILSKLKQAVPGSVLETSRFGRAQSAAVWLEPRTLREAASFLRNEPSIALDWAENLSAIQKGESLVVTYFLRSTARDHTLIARVSVKPASAAKEVELPSVARIWAMAEPSEIEIQELFGIRFLAEDGSQAHAPSQRLPKNWNGFPLRKDYVFPAEFLGIPHSRKGKA